MKKIFVGILVLAILITTFGPRYVFAIEDKKAYSQLGANMNNFIQSDYDNFLLIRGNYGYMTFIENFQSDAVSLYFLKMSEIFAGTSAEPDQKKYMEVLLNVIATYDLENSDAISAQYNMDNMKAIEDYALDFSKMGSKVVSVMAGNNPATSQFESSIATAVEGISVLTGNTNNWIDAIANLETIIQNYAKYDDFLKLIEERGEGELQVAARTLREGMSEAMEIKLNTYKEVSKENLEEYSEFFFDDMFFSILKSTPQYISDENVKFFVDGGDAIVSKINVLRDSWDLGTMIGKLVGNIAVGGEDIINRLMEMMALHDISVILQEEIIDLSKEFVNKYGTKEEENIVNNYILYSQYLIGCRIRGEYCMYSTVANDAGLLSWFNKEDANQAKEWYEYKTSIILNIQENLLKICDVQEMNNNSIKTNLQNDLNKMLSEIYGYGLRKYDKSSINFEDIMDFVYNCVYARGIGTYTEYKNTSYLAIDEQEMDEILDYFFGISAPKEQIGSVLYNDGKYYFIIHDFGKIGMPVILVNKIEENEMDVRVSFDMVYVWPENFDTGELNPIEDWNIYYDYSIEQIKDDKFCEVRGTGEAILEIDEDKIIVKKFDVYDNNIIMDGDYVTLTGTIQMVNNEIVFMLEHPYIFYADEDLIGDKIEDVGLTGNTTIDLNSIIGRKVKTSGQVMAAHTAYHYRPVMLLDGLNNLTLLDESINVEEEIEKIKSVYYSIQDNLPELYEEEEEGGIIRYYDSQNRIRKIACIPNCYQDMILNYPALNGYSAEYYYDENEQIKFVFVYNQYGVQHRFYIYDRAYCIRYIDDKGEIYDFSELEDPTEINAFGQFCTQAQLEIAWAYGG